MSILSLSWLSGLILVPAAYWLVPERFRSALLMGITLAILAQISLASVILLSMATGLAWVAYRYLSENGMAIAAIATAQTAPLVYYKAAHEWGDFPGPGLVIALGLSYYALRAIHYTLEAYKGTLPEHGVVDVISYMFFLPTIVAGPIHRFPQFFRDQERRRWNAELFSEGLERLLYGYVKITFVANIIINEWLTGFISDHLVAGSRQALYLTMVAKGLNGYFQFAGYSDVAIGFARLLGFRVIENFNAPLIRRNVQEFWQAWHISLTSWCRDYVYVPVFSLTRARWLGIICAMAVLGLWHEFTARYLVWGLYNGAGIVAWHQWRSLAGARLEAAIADYTVIRRIWTVISVLLTVHFIFIGFALVQNESLTGGLRFLMLLFGLS